MTQLERENLANLLFPQDLPLVEELKEKYLPRNIKGEVTRFAPSPTGFLHVGSLYTAFIAKTIANQSNGCFYLRIEDTDQQRMVENGIELIEKDLLSFGIMPDEGPLNEGIYGPYIQSHRKEIYHAFVKNLVKEGKAYPCFCQKEELESLRKAQELGKCRIGYYQEYATCRSLTFEEIKEKLEQKIPYVIRYYSKGSFNEKFTIHDEVKGEITMPCNDLDIILLKSDGLPTYHFAHVIDDYLMHTSIVIRGDEWLSSLPIHIQLFDDIFGFSPRYAHLAPLTTNDNGKVRKLSKRYDVHCKVSYYLEKGIPKDALKLYFATLMDPDFETWYMLDENHRLEDYTFSFSKMPIGGSLFDLEKLNSICKIYFAKESVDKLYPLFLEYYEKYDVEFADLMKGEEQKVKEFLSIEKNFLRPRKDIGCYADLKKEAWYIFNELFDRAKEKEHLDFFDDKVIFEYLEKNLWIAKDNDEWMSKLKEFLEKHHYAISMKDYKKNPENYQGSIASFCEMLRVMMTTKKVSPNLYELLTILGKEELLRRYQIYMKENFNEC